MDKPRWITITQRFLVMLSLTAMIFLGWVAGHITRQFIPVQDWRPVVPEFQHPPIYPTPQIKIGAEPTIVLVLQESPHGWVLEGSPLSGCAKDTYYLTYPAKCKTEYGVTIEIPERTAGTTIIRPK